MVISRKRLARRGCFAFSLLSIFLITTFARAHEDIRILEDHQGPFVMGEGDGAASGPGPSIAFESSGMHLLSWLPVGTLHANSVSGNDCWGYTAPSGREYAIIGTSHGTAFVEVTLPTDPVVVGFITGPTSLWRDIKVFGQYAYAVSEGGSGIQVINMGLIDSGIVSLANTINTPGTSQTHNVNIDVDSGFLYRLGGGGGTIGLRAYDLNLNPASPTFVGQWNQRYFHDAQIVTMTTGPYAGRQVAFCFSEDESGGGNPGVNILDVTDKANITEISQFSYSSPVYSHQGWISTDEQYLYINDELDEINNGTPTTTRVIDISDLDNPVEVGTFGTGSSSIDHNLYTTPNRIYESNYRSGIHVFDSTNPMAPTRIAYFDTYPEDDLTEFNGLWSNYPYFSSGIIIGSDLEKGLFVWGLGEPGLTFAYPDGLPEAISSNNVSIRVQVTAQPGSTLLNSEIQFHLDTGNGFVVTDLSLNGPDEYLATFPSDLACASTVRYYFSGETTNGLTWRSPETAPIAPFIGVVSDSRTINFEDDFETDMGWTVGDPSDTATTGIWTRVNPNGTAAQPENDHTEDPGTICYVTGQGAPGGSDGAQDIDGGETTLISPIFDASADTVMVSYWRWFSNNQGANPNEDVMVVEVSNNGGDTWTEVETVGPSSPESSGGWFFHRFLVSDVVAPSATMRLRFRAGDLGNGSVVEAGVDDFRVETFTCAPPCPGADGDINDDGLVNGNDVAAFVAALTESSNASETCAGDFNVNTTLDLGDVSGFVAAMLNQ